MLWFACHAFSLPLSARDQKQVNRGEIVGGCGEKGGRHLLWGVACLAIVLGGVPSVFADDDEPKDPYQAVWEDLSELLRRREYDNALAKLETLADDPTFRTAGARIEADKTAVAGLLALEQLVLKQAAELSPRTPLNISGIKYTVVRYERSSRGDNLVLRSVVTGKETKKQVADLPSATWITLAERDSNELVSPELTFGLFLAFDRVGDAKEARRFLNDAAGEGHDVSAWINRLDELEASRQITTNPRNKTKGANDPIVGHWSLTFPNNESITVEFRKNGTATATITPLMIAKARKAGRLPPPPDAGNWKWVRNDDGSYTVTAPAFGVTGKSVLVEDRLIFAPGPRGGQIKGLRQARP